MDDEHQESPCPPDGSIEDAIQPLPPLVTLDHLLAADVEAPLRGLASVNENVIRQAHLAACHQADEGSENRRVMELKSANDILAPIKRFCLATNQIMKTSESGR